MKRKIIILLIAVLLLASALTSCTYVPKVSLDTITRITLDAGASVELIVNRENNVVAVTPLNELASALLINEDLLKIAPDKAIDKIMNLALKSGFSGDKVLLSISGKSDYVDVITGMIEKKINKNLKKFKLDATIEHVEPATAAELRELFESTRLYTEDEMLGIGDDALTYYIALGRQETAFLPSSELKNFYYVSKECHMAIYTSEVKIEILETVKEDYPDAYDAYVGAFDMLKESALALEAAARELYLEASDVALDDYYSDLEAKQIAINSIEAAFERDVTIAIRSAVYQTQTTLIEKRSTFPKTFYEMYKSEVEAVKNALAEKKNELIK